MAKEAFAGARGARVFLSSLPGKARPGREGREEEEADSVTYERGRRSRAYLETYLNPLCQSGLMTVWHDGNVGGGREWEQEISEHLGAAEFILLLLSPQFLNSPFCYIQMQQALSRQSASARVIPVYLRPIPGWEDFPVSELTPLPGHGRPIYQASDEEWAWYEVATELRALLLRQGYQPAAVAAQPSPQMQAPPAYRDMLWRRPSVPYSPALAPRISLVEAVYRRLTREEQITALILTGVGGVGKTTLAALVYYHVEQEVRAGRGPFAHPPLWLEMSPDLSLRDVIALLSRALGRPLPTGLPLFPAGALAEELFTLLEAAGRLVVFDQFETWLDAQSGQPRQEYAGASDWLRLLNAGSDAFSGRVLLTGQRYPRRLFHLVQGCVQECEVSGLAVSEGVAFLRQDRVLAHITDAELAALVEHYQGHALALTALRACLVREAGIRVADLLHNPQRADRWIDELPAHSLDVLYRQLPPEQRALLRAFAIYRHAVPLEAIRALVPRRGIPGNRPDALPLALLDLRLLQALEQGCYRLHPAVASFVRQKGGAQHAAHVRAAGYYQQRFHAFQLAPGHWMLEAFHALLEAVWHLCQAEQRDEAYRLMQETGLFSQLHRRGYNNALLALYQDLLAGNTWQPEPAIAARIALQMGDIRNALGQKGEALQEYRRALAGFRQAGVPEGIVEALNNLGAMHQALQEYQPAREAYQEAMSLCAQTPRRLVQQGTTFNNLGRLAYIQGERARGAEDPAQARAAFREALSSYEQALAWFRADGLVSEETIALNNLGDACRALGASERARTTYWQALRRFQEQGDRRGEGLSLNNLGQLYHDLASQPGKQAYLEEERRCSIAALRLFRETGDRWQERIALRNLGRFYPIYQALEAGQRYQYALACLVLAGKIATELGLLQETPIPTWVEQTVRHWLGQTDGISYGTFVRDIEQRAAEIIEEILQSGR